MANNKYLRSTKRERELVNKARKAGMIACRSAGSHSPFDVWIVDHRDKVVRLIQVKTKKGGRIHVVKDERVFPGYTLITSTYSWGTDVKR